MNESTPLEKIVKLVPLLSRAKILSTEVLPGGLSNLNYLVTADEERFVVRIAGKNSVILGIDRVREAAAIRLAQDAGIAPEVVAFFLPDGHSVTRYLATAHPLTTNEFSSKKMIEKVATRLREIHALEPIEGDFNPYADIRRWLKIVKQRKIHYPERLAAVLARIDKIEHFRRQRDDVKRVLCHNDPYFKNFLYDGSLWVIDWEYAGMGDPLYDLAGVAYALDKYGRDHLLASYFGHNSQGLHTELNDLITVFLCWNIVWSLVQHDSSEIDHDYLECNEKLLDLVPQQHQDI